MLFSFYPGNKEDNSDTNNFQRFIDEKYNILNMLLNIFQLIQFSLGDISLCKARLGPALGSLNNIIGNMSVFTLLSFCQQGDGL